LILIPATAAVGMSVVIAEWGYAADILKRLAVDIALVIGVGLLFIYAKQKLVHKRPSLR
jgi:hypothetical protein